MSEANKIVNDSVKQNNLLQDVTFIQSKDLLTQDFSGEMVIIFKKGMMVHMKLHKGVKLD